MQNPVTIFWFRRDLRLHDNAGLHHALKEGGNVLPIFIFDRNILDRLEDRNDRRVDFIHKALQELQELLAHAGSSLTVLQGTPETVFPQLAQQYDINAVYTNRDYEPYARQRDQNVSELLAERGIAFRTFKDHVVFEPHEVLKDDGAPYSVFTPYSRKWKARLTASDLEAYPIMALLGNLHKMEPRPMPALEDLGFEPSGAAFPGKRANTEIIRTYEKTRDIPSIAGTTRLSVHLRFGTISIRELARQSAPMNERYLNELIWREFYQMILWQFPHVVDRAFKPAYDRIPWRTDEEDFTKWCLGETGYPIVDAGMRELNITGFMHNRVRMIVASFLTRHLLIDWRWGEAWFARHLLDFELASNNGGWQWAAGTGCDAQPYFRIFNPTSQTQKFDPEHRYIKKWVPEYQELSYPQPMVDHKFARERCLQVYKAALNGLPATVN